MVQTHEFTMSMFDELHSKFLANDDPDLSRDDWRRLFDSTSESDPTGFVLTDKGSIVGLLGTRFSVRHWQGVQHHFCNLHSWFVDEKYRGYSLLLMRPALQRKDLTLTDFTPTDRVCEISRRLGFQQLDATLRILPTVPHWPSRRSADWNVTSDVQELDGDSEIAKTPRTSLPHIRHLILRHTGNRGHAPSCYLAYSHIERHALPYAYIHYVSDPSVLASAHSVVRSEIHRDCGGAYVAIDARLVAGVRIPLSFALPIQTTQLYRPARERPTRIDNLDSEVSFLRLTTFPDISHRVKRYLARFLRKNSAA